MAVVAAVVLFSVVFVAPAAASGPSFLQAFGADVGGSGVDVCTTSCFPGTQGAAAGELNDAFGLAVAASGDVYVADTQNNRIDEFSQSGSFVEAFGLNVGGSGVDVCTTSCQVGSSGGAAGEFAGPEGVAVVGSGNLYVADGDNSRIDEYTQSGTFIEAFGLNVGGSGVDVCTTSCSPGSSGGAAGEFYAPLGVAVAGSDVYVADGGNNDRVDEFSQSGSFVRAFGGNVGGSGVDVCTTSCQAGSSGGAAGEFDALIGVAVAGSGDVYVADELNNRIDEFSQSGSFIEAFGSNVGGSGVDVCTTSCVAGSSGSAAGDIEDPAAVTVAGSGDVYIANFLNNRIDEFSQSGSFVEAFGLNVGGSGVDVCTTSCVAGTSGGLASEFDSPQGVALAGSGNLYVSDVGNQRIDEWGFKVTPVLSTSATASASAGSPISDAATLSGGNSPTGTITFDAYSTSNCSGTPAFASGAMTVSSGQASSGRFMPASPGTYYWTAAYSGDAANNPVTSGCNVPHETSIVTAAPTVAITTPGNGASYRHGKVVNASYSCSAPTGATITSCTGTTANGGAINTSTPGQHTFTVTATDSYGETATSSTTYTVITPVLSALRVTPSRLAVAGRKVGGRCVKATRTNRHHKSCQLAIKLKISYTLNVVDTVTLTLKLRTTGRKVRGRCVKQTRRNHKHAKCPLLVPVAGQIIEAATKGANSFQWNGHIGGHTLGLATYQLTATPAGGDSKTTTFTIL